MITAEIIIDERRKTKKGYPLKIRIYDTLEKKSSPHKYIPLKIYQEGPEIVYNSFLKRRSLDLEKEIEYCNNNFLRINEAYNIILNGIPIDDIEGEIQLLEFKLQSLYNKSGRNNQKGFIEFTNELIKERERLKIDTKAYRTLINIISILIEPKEDFVINDITKEFLRELEIKMIDRGNSARTIKTYFTYLSAIYTEAQSRESLNIKKTNPFYIIKVYNKNKVEYNITTDDLKKLLTVKVEDLSLKHKSKETTKEQLKRDIDIFLFQFAIGGHDLIDIANLQWGNIKDNRLVFQRTKNKNKTRPIDVDVMLSDFAVSIINKYGDKKNERIFSFIPDPNLHYDSYHNYLTSLNKSKYKQISKQLKLDTDLKTKAPRYIFRTIAGNELIDSYVIMKIQGHKPQGMTFGYQGALNYEVQDREHQKILDLVFND